MGVKVQAINEGGQKELIGVRGQHSGDVVHIGPDGRIDWMAIGETKLGGQPVAVICGDEALRASLGTELPPPQTAE